MWLFTIRGFYSVVACDGRKPGFVTVRARVRSHLNNLRPLIRKGVKPVIFEDTARDYRYRFFLHRKVWAEVARRLMREIDYGNFKAEAQAVGMDADYLDALHRIWFDARGMQKGNGATQSTAPGGSDEKGSSFGW